MIYTGTEISTGRRKPSELVAELWARKCGVTGSHDCAKLQAIADRLGLGNMVKEMLE